MKSIYQKSLLLLLAALAVLSGCTSAPSSETANNGSAKGVKKFKVAWSIYAGWQPWDYAGQSGILKKWADKEGIEIELIKMDYMPSLEAYVSEQVDACVMTNMEALDMPAASGITSSAIILGDYSNGNDALLVRDQLEVKDLKGREVSLVELSVSHYLLSRALEKNGMKESDLQIVNTSDSDIAPAFMANKEQKAVVTWNPLVMNIKQEAGVQDIFNSSAIPGEILDLMVVNTRVLEANPALGKALVGAWYEVMAIMKKEDAAAEAALEIMAESAGCSVPEFREQLKTTAMFYTPNSASSYLKSKEIMKSMDYVRKFCFDHGLLGENAGSFDEIGIRFPGGEVMGNKENIQLIFDNSFVEKEVVAAQL